MKENFVLVDEPKVTGSIFTIKVDYSQDLDTVIASHGFNRRNKIICSDKFPKPPSNGVVESVVKLFDMPKNLDTGSIVRKMNLEGFVPSNIFELNFLNLYQFSEQSIIIIAMGSEVPDNFGVKSFPCISINKEMKGLALIWNIFDWKNPNYKFLGTKKSSRCY
ncbi:MAG: hypothetical protein WC280_00660 [Patescibacteria group bacterium]